MKRGISGREVGVGGERDGKFGKKFRGRDVGRGVGYEGERENRVQDI